MSWNWQKKHWPNFIFDARQLELLEREYARLLGTVTGTTDKSMTVTFNGEEATIAIGPDTPIVELAPADAALLTPGAHVVAFARDEGENNYTTDWLIVGRDGLVPPM